MKSTPPVAFALLFILSGIASAQIYRCVGPDGKTVLQQTACATSIAQQAVNPEMKSPSLTDLVVSCSKLPKESTDYAVCAAQISCMENGSQGKTLQTCVDKLTDARRRADRREEERALAEREKAKRQLPNTNATEPVDCIDLGLYAKAKGHNFIERAAIVNEAREIGRCISKQAK